MTDTKKLKFFPIKLSGTFHIKSNDSLKDVADKINKALGICLAEDLSGYYEEFPAYSCNVLGIQFALLGSPEEKYRMPDQDYTGYELHIADNNKYDGESFMNFGVNLINILESQTDLQCNDDWESQTYMNRAINIVK